MPECVSLRRLFLVSAIVVLCVGAVALSHPAFVSSLGAGDPGWPGVSR